LFKKGLRSEQALCITMAEMYIQEAFMQKMWGEA